MSNISFTAHGRCARATYCEPITAGSVGLLVSFAFDAAWSGLQKTAIFRGSGMAVDLVLSGDAATVPPEVLTIPGGDLRVGVWGADPDGNVIIPTVWATVGEIVPGAAPSGFDPQPPTPSWAAQVQEIAQDALDTANSVREDADAGAFDGATYTPAVSAGGDLSWTNDKKKPNPPTVNIQGPEGQTGATPDISIGTVTTGAAGSQAEATMTGTPERPVLNLTIPRGDPGEVTQAEFDDLADEVTQQKSALDDLTALVDSKAGMLIDTASGAIASFVPDSTIDNLLGVSIAVEPVQDLHGQDAPYPAGGGKNKLNSAFCINRTAHGLTSTLNADGSISLTGTSDGIARYWNSSDTLGLVLPAGTYHLSDHIRLEKPGGGIASGTFTLADQTTFQNVIFYGYASGEVVNATIYPQLEAGSTATAYAPYSNECPISGWDVVEVEADGANLFDFVDYSTWVDGYLRADGTPSGTAAVAPAYERCSSFVPIKGGQTYTMSYEFTGTIPAGGAASNNICFYDSNMNMVGERASSFNQTSITATAPSNAAFLRFSHRTYGMAVNYMLSIGSTAMEYKPYAGNTYAITLGQTVYGCKLTIAEDGSVMALVDRAMIVADGVNVKCTGGYASGAQRVPGINIGSQKGNFEKRNLIVANYLAYANYPQDVRNTIGMFSNGDWIALHINDIKGIGSGTPYPTDADLQSAANAYLQENPLQICYVLKTPLTIQLYPVTIAAIAGQTNNVWADAGDVSVTYAADIKSYIDRLNQPTEDDMIANTLIAANKYFTVNNRLFLSTASIAAGAQIIPGTNCTETSLVEALNALNA